MPTEPVCVTLASEVCKALCNITSSGLIHKEKMAPLSGQPCSTPDEAVKEAGDPPPVQHQLLVVHVQLVHTMS